MVKERDDLVYLAKLAEQAERFDEMVRIHVERFEYFCEGFGAF